MRMRNNRSKIRWDFVGYVSPEFKYGNNRSLSASVAQLRTRSEQIGSGKRKTSEEVLQSSDVRTEL